jgi:transcriptional regulator with XRE-family HTH domain
MPRRLTRTLAVRLREERRRGKLSLRKLAEVSGLSPTTIFQIEAGRASPSLATLQSLARALDVPLATLLEGMASTGTKAVLLPARGRPRTEMPGGSLERLASGLLGQRIQGLLVTLDPGASTGDEAMIHSGQEIVFVLGGRCVYEVAGTEHALGPGDSLVLDSRQPHRARNPTRRRARVLLALLAPEGEPEGTGGHRSPPPRRPSKRPRRG